jgi:nucleoid DNA-binding protein
MATGFRELVLVPALMEPGHTDVGPTADEARAVIKAILGSITDALLRHEQVELPIGTFTVVQNPEQRRAWKFGQITTFYSHRYRVEFLPSDDLDRAAAAAPPSPPDSSRKRKKKIVIKSDLTISTELIIEFIRKNVEAGNWTLFFREVSDISPYSFELFKRNRPKTHELRPLDEAAQVIA